MPRIPIPDGPEDAHKRIWQLAPHLSKPARSFISTVYADSQLPVRLRELMRMRTANINHSRFDWTPALRRWRNMISPRPTT